MLVTQTDAGTLGFTEDTWNSRDHDQCNAREAGWNGAHHHIIEAFGFIHPGGRGLPWDEGGTRWPIKELREVRSRRPRAAPAPAEAPADAAAEETAAEEAAPAKAPPAKAAPAKAAAVAPSGGKLSLKLSGKEHMRVRGGAFPLEALKEFEHLMGGADRFPVVVSVHHCKRQLLQAYMHDHHEHKACGLDFMASNGLRPYENTTKALAARDYYQDESSCALDALNLAVGRVCAAFAFSTAPPCTAPCTALPADTMVCFGLVQMLLVRSKLEEKYKSLLPGWKMASGKGIKKYDNPAKGPVQFAHPVVLSTLAQHKIVLRTLKDGNSTPLTFIMGQAGGLFLVEFFWQRGGARTSDWHVIAGSSAVRPPPPPPPHTHTPTRS